MAQMSEPDRIDISIEHKRAEPEPSAKRHPNTCPECGSHYRDEELTLNLRVCAQCGHHFPVRAPERIAQLADGTFTEANEDTPIRRSASVLRPEAVYGAPGEAELSTGLGDALITGTAKDRVGAVPAGRDGLLLHGRIDGKRRRREVRPCLRGLGGRRHGAGVRCPHRVARACRRILSLMQLPKTVCAVEELRDAGVVLVGART